MDIAIAVGVMAFTCLLAFMGVYVTLHPPESVLSKRIWKIAFGLVALLTCVITGWQTKRNADAQNALQTQLSQIRKNTETPPQVTVNVPPSPPPQIILSSDNRLGGSLNLAKIELPPSLDASPFAVNVHLRNVGQSPIPDVYYWVITTFQPLGENDSNTADRKAYFAFLKLGKQAVKESKKAGHAPTYYAVGDDHWGTMLLHPRREETDGVIRGTTRLYFFAYAEWDGGKSQYASCRWLQPPAEVNYGNGANLVLHDCVW